MARQEEVRRDFCGQRETREEENRVTSPMESKQDEQCRTKVTSHVKEIDKKIWVSLL